ncbi:hypothetical protein PCH_Pc22g11530 [Penicillium rubens Wisconsin 54-1255]|uniref:Uncharacterized protein n=1 Tax=Penicillium rubens (strain ATCC 28089 / DSM 1075 / NRRL 1951 / Wisconsin 54-1255) TaxID=500485 RepID=B6HQA7_PENRW|nr:hypothetical protein PCH_Pc22g11530 [Penicillium rubens Wisconsin 54-1255]
MAFTKKEAYRRHHLNPDRNRVQPAYLQLLEHKQHMSRSRLGAAGSPLFIALAMHLSSADKLRQAARLHASGRSVQVVWTWVLLATAAVPAAEANPEARTRVVASETAYPKRLEDWELENSKKFIKRRWAGTIHKARHDNHRKGKRWQMNRET